MTIGQVFQTRGFDFRLERIEGNRAIVRGLQSGKRATVPIEQLDRYLTAESGGNVAMVKQFQRGCALTTGANTGLLALRRRRNNFRQSAGATGGELGDGRKPRNLRI